MSASADAGRVSALDDAAEAALAAVEELTGKDAARNVSDDTAQQLLLAGVRLYAHKVDTENRHFPAVPPSATLSATEVAVTVTELMRQVDLNMFDLAMWSGRARPDEES